MNKHVDIKLETANGNRAGCRLEPEEVADLVERLRGKRRVDASGPRDTDAIAFGDGSER